MLRNALWLFILSVFILFAFLPSYTKMQDLKQKNSEYQWQIKLLKERQIKLREEKRLLEEDPAYLEKVARDKMGLIKEGEVIYQIKHVDNRTK